MGCAQGGAPTVPSRARRVTAEWPTGLDIWACAMHPNSLTYSQRVLSLCVLAGLYHEALLRAHGPWAAPGCPLSRRCDPRSATALHTTACRLHAAAADLFASQLQLVQLNRIKHINLQRTDAGRRLRAGAAVYGRPAIRPAGGCGGREARTQHAAPAGQSHRAYGHAYRIGGCGELLDFKPPSGDLR